ncbi:GNAT family N-acetyltransferase [Corynebacterium breve]|uniref:GNAT family N-acetyltransferase n=1 Tax=Corynebacterium breve TaxID=3049799 RepID=A0ABY8VCR9_9CORY|nr:GNAT family N-acetyltransferase [Corynebacterium breve]WIM67288.1 GNAT family N-acetyltransferase [Corynebacterium breve]
MSGNTEIDHQPEKLRYIIKVDGREAGYAEYVPLGDEVLDFNHTVIDQAYRGHGLSSILLTEVLTDVRRAGKKVRPTCSAVERFFEKNEAFQDLREQ